MKAASTHENAVLRSVTAFYCWLYYRCYRHSQSADFKWSRHWANASIYVLMLLMMNLGALGALFAGVTGLWPKVSEWTVGLVLAGLCLGHTCFLGYKERYKRIIRGFANESVDEQRRGDRLFFWYVAGSFGVFIVTALIGAMIRRLASNA